MFLFLVEYYTSKTDIIRYYLLSGSIAMKVCKPKTQLLTTLMVIAIEVGALGTIPNGLEKKTGGIGNQKKNKLIY